MTTPDTQPTQQAAATPATFRPAVDIVETNEAVFLHLDLPGVSEDRLELDFDKGMLSIAAKVASRQPPGTTFLHQEYGVGDFARSFRIGDTIDAAGITATLRDGELTVRLPKHELAKPRKISVQRPN